MESVTPNSSQLCWQFNQRVPRRTISVRPAPGCLVLTKLDISSVVFLPHVYVLVTALMYSD
ncbi:MAG: hypothetical protein AAF915_11700 [Cyanobacteria bacterium P01_D01_bin.50]